MESKYYTPDVDEFFVGFEYESLYRNVKEYWWNKSIWKTNDSVHNFFNLQVPRAYSIPNSIRVKYLDKEDIESLGFHTEDNGECYNLQIGFDLYGLYPWENNRVHVTKDMKTLFNGIIKNKSELKKLLIQLSIL